jgi:hypothetical protein
MRQTSVKKRKNRKRFNGPMIGICLLVMPVFQPGDPAPEGYLQNAEWARVQLKAGLRQQRCSFCGLWRFPQEKCHEKEKKKLARSGIQGLSPDWRRINQGRK